MAGVALGRGLDMLRMFTGGKGAVMAIRTVAADLEIIMIKVDQCPVGGRRMTTIALGISRDVLRRFAAGGDTVMTA